MVKMLDHSMKSAMKFLITGYILSSIIIQIGFIAEIQEYLSVWCFLFGLYILRKENRIFQLSYAMQIIIMFIFVLSQILLYITPLQIPLSLTWTVFIMSCIRNLIILYGCHLYLPSINLVIVMVCEMTLIVLKIFFQSENIHIVFALIIILLIITVGYQLYKGLKEAEHCSLKNNVSKIPIGKMVSIFLIGGLAISIATLYIWPYLVYKYTDEKQELTVDYQLTDTLTLSNGWKGDIYQYNENANVYVFHYKGKLPKKCSYIEITPPYRVYGGHLSLDYAYFGNGSMNYHYDERYSNGANDFLIFGQQFAGYRIYINPSDDTFEATLQYKENFEEESKYRSEEFVFNVCYYEYGKVNKTSQQQVIFQSDNLKWRPELTE